MCVCVAETVAYCSNHAVVLGFNQPPPTFSSRAWGEYASGLILPDGIDSINQIRSSRRLVKQTRYDFYFEPVVWIWTFFQRAAINLFCNIQWRIGSFEWFDPSSSRNGAQINGKSIVRNLVEHRNSNVGRKKRKNVPLKFIWRLSTETWWKGFNIIPGKESQCYR